MNSKLPDFFSGTLSAHIDKEVLNITRLFNRMLESLDGTMKALPEEFSVEFVREKLFQSVVKDLSEGTGAEETSINPEEIAIRLIRHGIPKESIRATFKHLTAALPNADYRLYRETSRYPAGTIRITWNGCSVNISPRLSTEDTVLFMLLLDENLPRIDEAAGSLFDELQKEYRNKQKEMKALEIARKAVEALLADVLPGMGIKVEYNITDGKVKLHLTRNCTGEVELPLDALRDFLSDPGRVESALKVDPVAPESEKSPDFPHPFPPKFFRSNIVLNPK